MKNNKNEILDLLLSEGVHLTTTQMEMLDAYCSLVREWNPIAGLVSKEDIDRLWDAHIVDSLSLAPIVARLCKNNGIHLDIGSGGGFPAIPIKIALPELPIILIDRGMKSVGFLRKVVSNLQLGTIEIRLGEFPSAAKGIVPTSVTARAIEKPERMLPKILKFLPPGATFIAQTSIRDIGAMFHVEHCNDIWSIMGLRRGSLTLVQRIS